MNQKNLIQVLQIPEWQEKGLIVSVLRDDLVHPYMMGNKWRKLKYNLIEFRTQNKKVMLTFGGAFSNHILAVAAAGKENNFATIGIIRGEEVLNDYTDFAKSSGMKLHFISRGDYKRKEDPDYIHELKQLLIDKEYLASENDIYLLPEGGANELAVKGASEIMDDVPADSDYIACACGTGATIAGISTKLLSHQKAIGISVLKAENYFEERINQLNGNIDKVIMNYNYHFGGYGKKTDQLEKFCERFFETTNVPIEPVYTGKLFFAINDLIKSDYFKPGTKVTVIHTGGTVFHSSNRNISGNFLHNSALYR